MIVHSEGNIDEVSRPVARAVAVVDAQEPLRLPKPHVMQRVLVGRPCLPLVAGDLRLEVVVLGLLGQLGHHLHPDGLATRQDRPNPARRR